MKPYGVLAEFETEAELVHAVHMAQSHGFRHLETYTPMPVEKAAILLGRRNWLPPLALAGGISGAVATYFLQSYIAIWLYPTNVGGRPLHSWPSFIVPSFEIAILGASVAIFAGAVLLGRMPRPYHPLLNSERFTAASRDRFFLCIEARDAHFHPEETADFLRGLNAQGVETVEE